MNSDTDKKGPAVKFPPPLVFFLLILIGYALQKIIPIMPKVVTEIMPAVQILGAITFLFGVTIVLLSAYSFWKAETHIEPWQPTSAIISTGLFAYSRNPIYLAFSLLTIGIGLYLNNIWIILSFIPSSIIVFHLAIKKKKLI